MDIPKETVVEKLGFIFFHLLIRLFNLFWKGLKVARDNKVVLIVYIVLGVLTILSFFVIISIEMIVFSCVVITMFGIWEHIKEIPKRKKRKYFDSIFKEIGLHSNGKDIPSYMDEENINEYTCKVTFYGLIPLSEWNKKKEVLEKHLNLKIIDITEDSHDNRLVYLFIKKEELPDYKKWCDTYIDYRKERLNIGVSYQGIIGMDLEQYPHAFIAGETQCGKSNILKCMIHQSLCKNYEVVLIDFKQGVTFTSFQDIAPIYFEEKETLEVLNDITTETKRRLDLFREYGVESLKDYNKYASNTLRRKIIFIDELAELLRIEDKESSKLLYSSIETLARLSRAAGIHLIMGIQRPDSTIISGQIKSNVSFRACGRFPDPEPSRIVLGNDKATTLKNIKGRVIVRTDKFCEVQSFYYESKALNKPREERKAATLDQTISEEKASPKELKTADNKEPLKQTNFIFNFTDIEYKKED